MRKIGFAVLFGFIGTSAIFAGGGSEKGNGDVVTFERPVPAAFENVELSTNGIVQIHQSESARISVTIDANLEKRLVTEINNGTLRIKQKGFGFFRPSVNTIEVYLPDIKKATVSGSGSILFIDKIIAESLRLNISGSGGINGNIECNGLTADISGSGKMALSGKSGNANLNISGSGSYLCEALEVNDAGIKISGAGNAKVYVLNTLEGKVSGSGDIFYKGNPKITFSGSGSGKLKTLD